MSAPPAPRRTPLAGSTEGLGRQLGRQLGRGLGSDPTERIQNALMWTGAVLMPLGLIVIVLGYIGVSHAVYDFDRQSYFYSGGFIGLGLVFLGGFLYFGSWLARMSADNREASRRLLETLTTLSTLSARTSSAPADAGLVTAGRGTKLHRRDCPLVGDRTDLHPADPGAAAGVDATLCRVCLP